MRSVYLTEFLWRLTLTLSEHPGWCQALARCSLRLIVWLLNQPVREFTKLANLIEYSVVSLQQFNHPPVWRQPNFLAPCRVMPPPPPPMNTQLLLFFFGPLALSVQSGPILLFLREHILIYSPSHLLSLISPLHFQISVQNQLAWGALVLTF